MQFVIKKLMKKIIVPQIIRHPNLFSNENYLLIFWEFRVIWK